MVTSVSGLRHMIKKKMDEIIALFPDDVELDDEALHTCAVAARALFQDALVLYTSVDEEDRLRIAEGDITFNLETGVNPQTEEYKLKYWAIATRGRLDR